MKQLQGLDLISCTSVIEKSKRRPDVEKIAEMGKKIILLSNSSRRKGNSLNKIDGTLEEQCCMCDIFVYRDGFP